MDAAEPRTWCTIDSPIGPLTLLASQRGLSYIAFAAEDFTPPVHCVRGTSPVLEQASTELAEYFAGRRRDFAVLVDAPSPITFRAQAQRCLREIPYGHTWSYSELAARAGRPSAARAAGSACATNPVPIIVPCHRVLRADGSTGHYRGGASAKAFLLALEARNQSGAGAV
ncbi:methylated-DNA--[protein]-cysteine S-methyltransferase [Corynebacterium sp.]|uniref:methylated-DNA--[protein]-cysteine S-methyltransferase n=1 Tax=Corynebacterium sp. TaxID=1720 RepID=UPI0026DC71A1|nr:methylated-DNA--[protein]-cysteine S-methyltransferase [Corynebacterium sp.]MDO5033031.1 methylated-DNA--[protein]-cysteine S-methyltransferase [Corynebacterium sp.]